MLPFFMNCFSFFQQGIRKIYKKSTPNNLFLDLIRIISIHYSNILYRKLNTK